MVPPHLGQTICPPAPGRQSLRRSIAPMMRRFSSSFSLGELVMPLKFNPYRPAASSGIIHPLPAPSSAAVRISHGQLDGAYRPFLLSAPFSRDIRRPDSRDKYSRRRTAATGRNGIHKHIFPKE
jgi:hypothetical protein